MKDKESRILFLDDQGREIEFMVLEQTSTGRDKLPACCGFRGGRRDSFDYERNLTGGGYVSYEIIEDEEELEIISRDIQ